MKDINLNDLYNIYRSNIKVDQFPINENNSSIKVGDILVALYNNKEVRGEVSAVYENYYVLKGKNGSTVKILIDDVTEHYPKNRAFDNKSANKRFTESVVQQEPQQRDVERVENKKRKALEEIEEEEVKNHPDEQVDLTVENNALNNIKAIGKMIYYKTVKYKEVNDLFEKKLLSKEDYWYLLNERINEIHIIRNNEKGFQMQPFANSLVGHFLKSQNKLINESYGQLKVTGNSSFSIISNIPDNIHKQLLNSLISLLSGVKK